MLYFQTYLSSNTNADGEHIGSDKHYPGIALHEEEGAGELPRVNAATRLPNLRVSHLEDHD